ncbi:MAG: hypothetical protein ACLS5Y_04985 [Clostridia bacterium]
MDNSKLENIEAIAFLTLISINGMVLSTSQEIIRTCSSASLITSFIVSLLNCVVLILSLFTKIFSEKAFRYFDFRGKNLKVS